MNKFTFFSSLLVSLCFSLPDDNYFEAGVNISYKQSYFRALGVFNLNDTPVVKKLNLDKEQYSFFAQQSILINRGLEFESNSGLAVRMLGADGQFKGANVHVDVRRTALDNWFASLGLGLEYKNNFQYNLNFYIPIVSSGVDQYEEAGFDSSKKRIYLQGKKEYLMHGVDFHVSNIIHVVQGNQNEIASQVFVWRHVESDSDGLNKGYKYIYGLKAEYNIPISYRQTSFNLTPNVTISNMSKLIGLQIALVKKQAEGRNNIRPIKRDVDLITTVNPKYKKLTKCTSCLEDGYVEILPADKKEVKYFGNKQGKCLIKADGFKGEFEELSIDTLINAKDTKSKRVSFVNEYGLEVDYDEKGATARVEERQFLGEESEKDPTETGDTLEVRKDSLTTEELEIVQSVDKLRKESPKKLSKENLDLLCKYLKLCHRRFESNPAEKKAAITDASSIVLLAALRDLEKNITNCLQNRRDLLGESFMAIVYNKIHSELSTKGYSDKQIWVEVTKILKEPFLESFEKMVPITVDFCISKMNDIIIGSEATAKPQEAITSELYKLFKEKNLTLFSIDKEEEYKYTRDFAKKIFSHCLREISLTLRLPFDVFSSFYEYKNQYHPESLMAKSAKVLINLLCHEARSFGLFEPAFRILNRVFYQKIAFSIAYSACLDGAQGLKKEGSIAAFRKILKKKSYLNIFSWNTDEEFITKFGTTDDEVLKNVKTFYKLIQGHAVSSRLDAIKGRKNGKVADLLIHSGLKDVFFHLININMNCLEKKYAVPNFNLIKNRDEAVFRINLLMHKLLSECPVFKHEDSGDIKAVLSSFHECLQGDQKKDIAIYLDVYEKLQDCLQKVYRTRFKDINRFLMNHGKGRTSIILDATVIRKMISYFNYLKSCYNTIEEIRKIYSKDHNKAMAVMHVTNMTEYFRNHMLLKGFVGSSSRSNYAGEAFVYKLNERLIKSSNGCLTTDDYSFEIFLDKATKSIFNQFKSLSVEELADALPVIKEQTMDKGKKFSLVNFYNGQNKLSPAKLLKEFTLDKYMEKPLSSQFRVGESFSEFLDYVFDKKSISSKKDTFQTFDQESSYVFMKEVVTQIEVSFMQR